MLLLALLLMLLGVVVVKHVRSAAKLGSFPPGPRRWPVLGSALSMPGRAPHLDAARWREQFGPLVGLVVAGRRIVVACAPREVMALLRHEHCQGRPDGFGFRHRSFGQKLGVLFSDGPYWVEQRRFTLRELRDLGFGKASLEGVVMDEVDAVAAEMLRGGTEADLHPTDLFHEPMLNVLWWLVSGRPLPRGASAMRVLQDLMHRIMRSRKRPFLPCDLLPALRHVAPEWSGYNASYPPVFELQRFIRDEIEQQRRGGAGGAGGADSYMAVYCREVERRKGQPSGFTEESLIVTCMDLFLAGGESASNTLSFALLYLVLHPDVQGRAHAELDAAVGRAETVTLQDRPRLPYLEAVLTEVMRINTIAPLCPPHTTTADVHINGLVIPKGTMLLLSLWSVLHDEDHWGDPANFRPERFLDQDGRFVRDPYMVQFSLGKRQCIGEPLAQQFLFLFLSNLLSRFEFSLPAGAPRPSTDAAPGFTTSTQPYAIKARGRAQGRPARN